MTAAHDLALATYRNAVRLLEAHQAATPHLERCVVLAEIAVRETAPCEAPTAPAPTGLAIEAPTEAPAVTRTEAPTEAPPSEPPPAPALEPRREAEAPAKAPSEPPPALTEAPRSPAVLAEGTGDDEPEADTSAKPERQAPPAPPARVVPATLPPPPADVPAAVNAGAIERPREAPPASTQAPSPAPASREARRLALPKTPAPPAASDLQDRIVALLAKGDRLRNHEIAKALDWPLYEVNHALAMLQRSKRALKDDRVHPAVWSAPAARRGAA